MKKLWVVFLLILLTGCSAEAQTPAPELVSAVHVRYAYKRRVLERTYTDVEKMDMILHYLYALTPSGTAREDPEQLWDDDCRITLLLSNGKKRLYLQRGGRYLSVDHGAWHKIDPKQGSKLFPLISAMEGDTLPSAALRDRACSLAQIFPWNIQRRQKTDAVLGGHQKNAPLSCLLYHLKSRSFSSYTHHQSHTCDLGDTR